MPSSRPPGGYVTSSADAPRTLRKQILQPFFAELLARRVEGFGHAVGECDQQVARAGARPMRPRRHLREQPEHRASRREFGDLDAGVARAHEERRIVPGVDVAQLARAPRRAARRRTSRICSPRSTDRETGSSCARELRDGKPRLARRSRAATPARPTSAAPRRRPCPRRRRRRCRCRRRPGRGNRSSRRRPSAPAG